MTEPAMIEVRGLTKYYGPFPAIQGLHFTVGRGEIVGFLGPNGAGKTTTMRILTGYMPPTEGEVRVAGFDALKQSLQARAHIGYLPENVPLYPEMTIWGYLNYMARLRKVPNREDRVDEAMEMTHITSRAESYIGTLSKGWRQRVGLAQALLHQPDVLILDEPTIGLDPRQVREVREVIRSVGADRTVLLSTHILSEVTTLCNRVIIISGGQIREDMPLDEAITAAVPRQLLLRVASGAEQAVEAIRRMPGIERVNQNGDGTIQVWQKSGADHRAKLADLISGQGWGLLELRPVGISLEDRFLEVTQADQAKEEEDEEVAASEEEVDEEVPV